jgi:hypothetical protein
MTLLKARPRADQMGESSPCLLPMDRLVGDSLYSYAEYNNKNFIYAIR